jgi:D-beta-D-heptose 7-phosphate kinase/D-beta-D-heptose 1-phosphate adenosyltransferase
LASSEAPGGAPAVGTLLGLLGRYHAGRVLVVGDLMLDRFVYGSVERISPEAPIPVLQVERRLDVPGGAANVARNIAALGGRATLLGVTGADVEAEDLRTRLAGSASIEAHLIVDASRPTTLKTRYVADGQQVMRADRELRAPVDAAIAERLLQEFPILAAAADIVVLSDYAKGVLTDAVTRALIEAARRLGKTLIVDPKSRDFGRYRGATLLTPNRLELQSATGEECATDAQVAAAAAGVLAAGICDVLVVTRGRDGLSIVSDGLPALHLPAEARQVFDVSGAGDTVVAALALGLAAGGTMSMAGALANLAAGIVVGKRGTATVSTGELLAALSQFAGTTDSQKIFALESVMPLVRSWRDQGLKVAFANGCFDLLHPGHISLLEQARRSADRLVVGLNSDLSVRRLKGPDRPVQSEVARATVLAAVKAVDAVVIFADDTPLELIETLEPDVLVKGEDYTLEQVVGADRVLARGGRVLLARIMPGHSTTDTVRRAAARIES